MRRRTAGNLSRGRVGALIGLFLVGSACLLLLLGDFGESSREGSDRSEVPVDQESKEMDGNPLQYTTEVVRDGQGNFNVRIMGQWGQAQAVQLTWALFGRLLQSDGRLRAQMTAILRDCPFEAFFWETRPLTGGSASSTPFEFMLVNSPTLARVTANGRPFQDFIGDKKGTEAVEVFANLSGDALLVVPAQSSTVAANSYAHIANFVRSAPEAQVDLLWSQVSRALEQRIAERGLEAPLWVSTSGLGVYWLHVRIDNRPKYYQHGPYRTL